MTLDQLTFIKSSPTNVSPVAREVLAKLPATPFEVVGFFNVIPGEGKVAPVRPFLHRGDWMDDGQGGIWTVLTASLRENEDGGGVPYLWHQYEAAYGMHFVA